MADFSEFMESLPRGSVDLILTDPPYTISKETGFQSVVNGVQRFAVSMDFGAWDHCQIDLAEIMARVFYRALRQGGTAIVWYDLWKIGEIKEAMERRRIQDAPPDNLGKDQSRPAEHARHLPVQLPGR